MGKKCFNLGSAQFRSMALVVEEDEAANPLLIGFLSAVGVVLYTNCLPHLIQEFLRVLLHK
jgi:hypothetical protein